MSSDLNRKATMDKPSMEHVLDTCRMYKQERAAAERERELMFANLTATQKRCTALLERARTAEARAARLDDLLHGELEARS
jgi:hypothetical protein